MSDGATRLGDDLPVPCGVPAVPEPAGIRREGGGFDYGDLALVGAIVLVSVLLHPIHAMLTRPYWLDEAWLAALTRAPLWRVPRLNASTPVGFVALVKLVPGSGLQRGRLVVLGFSALTALMAYAIVRRLRWNSGPVARRAALATGLVVALIPLSRRIEFKQYTSDAFFALVVLYVAAAMDRSSNTKAAWPLAATALVSLPFSSTAAFVSIAAFAGLLASQLLRHSRKQARTTLITGAATGILMASYFVLVVLPSQNAKLRAYWNRFYLRGSPWRVLESTWARLSRIEPALTIKPLLFVVLCAAGIAALAHMRERALAIAFLVLWFEMMLLGYVQRYPFLDLRTSEFLLESSVVVAAVGAIALLRHIGRANVAIGTALALALGLSLVAGSVPHLYDVQEATEDTRAQTQYVANHRRAGDVILVSKGANGGFSYYWPNGRIKYYEANLTKGFRTEVAGVDAIYAQDGSQQAVLASLRAALDRWRHAPGGSHLFMVRSHLKKQERKVWESALQQLRVQPATLEVGPESLLMLGRP